MDQTRVWLYNLVDMQRESEQNYTSNGRNRAKIVAKYKDGNYTDKDNYTKTSWGVVKYGGARGADQQEQCFPN